MSRTSAGLLPYRWRDGRLEVFLVHPGGPFWANKDAHAWSVAKGEVEQKEDLLDAARREFAEETGLTMAGPILPLTPLRHASGKLVHVWAIEADIEPSTCAHHGDPTTDSMNIRPVIPRTSDHPLQQHPTGMI
jgi:predicted NUDIX family NTP pyrophosphohydrolase